MSEVKQSSLMALDCCCTILRMDWSENCTVEPHGSNRQVSATRPMAPRLDPWWSCSCVLLRSLILGLDICLVFPDFQSYPNWN